MSGQRPLRRFRWVLRHPCVCGVTSSPTPRPSRSLRVGFSPSSSLCCSLFVCLVVFSCSSVSLWSPLPRARVCVPFIRLSRTWRRQGGDSPVRLTRFVGTRLCSVDGRSAAFFVSRLFIILLRRVCACVVLRRIGAAAVYSHPLHPPSSLPHRLETKPPLG